jgi:glycosyltransferase involved in cell wall biosynthesis
VKVQVITLFDPPDAGRDEQGGFRRLALFMRALAGLAPRIDIAHLVPEAAVAATDAAALDRAQSEYWGHPVAVTPIPRRRRQETFYTQYIAGLGRAGEQPMLYPYAGAAQADAVGALLDRAPDLVVVNGLAAMLAVLRSGRRPPRMLFDLMDVDHLVRRRWCLERPVWPGKLAMLAQLPALLAAEWQGARRARLTTVCSRRDRAHLRHLGFPRVAMVPNAVTLPAAPPPPAAAPTLLFLGACTYPPNVQAAERMATKILPLVRRAVPGARLLLAGKDSEKLPSRGTAPEGVDYLGFVDDLAALYARTRVVCCPISQGGGTRVKLVEAAGYARPMVATRIGAEGLEFADGTEIFLRDDDAAFAAACVELLRDGETCARMGAAARARAQRLYDGDAIQDEIARMLRGMVEGRALPGPVVRSTHSRDGA